jgi:hypothetical protein
MRSHQTLQRKIASNLSPTSTAGLLTTRPFAEPTQAKQIEELPTASISRNLLKIPNLFTPSTPLSTIQQKLTIGEPGDKYEQEADRVAADVVKKLNAPALPPMDQPLSRDGNEKMLQRPSPKPTCSQAMLSRKESMQKSTDTPCLQADFENRLNRARGGGSLLNAGLRSKIEPIMGADFSRVKIHTDAEADRLSRSIQAKAFTTGQDVFFRQGAYEPGSRGGQELIAHELTHVVQQNERDEGARVQRFSVAKGISAPDIKIDTEDGYGGHTRERHIGKKDDYLKKRAQEIPEKKASSYTDDQVAENMTKKCLQENWPQIQNDWQGTERIGARGHIPYLVDLSGNEFFYKIFNHRGKAVKPKKVVVWLRRGLST